MEPGQQRASTSGSFQSRRRCRSGEWSSALPNGLDCLENGVVFLPKRKHDQQVASNFQELLVWRTDSLTWLQAKLPNLPFRLPEHMEKVFNGPAMTELTLAGKRRAEPADRLRKTLCLSPVRRRSPTGEENHHRTETKSITEHCRPRAMAMDIEMFLHSWRAAGGIKMAVLTIAVLPAVPNSEWPLPPNARPQGNSTEKFHITNYGPRAVEQLTI